MASKIATSTGICRFRCVLMPVYVAHELAQHLTSLLCRANSPSASEPHRGAELEGGRIALRSEAPSAPRFEMRGPVNTNGVMGMAAGAH